MVLFQMKMNIFGIFTHQLPFEKEFLTCYEMIYLSQQLVNIITKGRRKHLEFGKEVY